MKNFVQPGEVVEVASASRTVTAGGGYLMGHIFGIIANDANCAGSAEMMVEGVFDIAKDASVFAAGALVYWDDSTHECTSTTSSNKIIGIALVAALTGDITARVRLNEAWAL